MVARLLFVAMSVCCFSCGYSTRSMLPGEAQAVAIEAFGNETFVRQIEIQLTRDLTEEFLHRTACSVTGRADADAVVGGRIVSIRRPTLVGTEGDLVSEQAVIVTAEVHLKATGTGKVLAFFLLSSRAEYVVERGETLKGAFAEAIRDLAENIVNRLQSGSFLKEMGVKTE